MSNAHGKILLVEDDASNLHFLAAALRDEDYELSAVSSGEQALALASRTIPDLILLDVNLPGMNGYQVCERLRADELLRDIPIIFLSGFDDERAKLYAFEAGGVDYITKPIRLAEVLARVKSQIDLRRKQKELMFKVQRMGLEVSRRQQTEIHYRTLYP